MGCSSLALKGAFLHGGKKKKRGFVALTSGIARNRNGNGVDRQ